MSLTPAYDICPQSRSGNEASQAMKIFGDYNLSQFKNCLSTAHNFLLSVNDARSIVEMQREIVSAKWTEVCDEAKLSEVDRKLLWQRQFLNPFALQE